MDTITKVLHILRETGKSQKDLADHLEIQPSIISDWKSGRNKSLPHYLGRIADYLGVSVDYLLGNNENKENAPGHMTEREMREQEIRRIVESFSTEDQEWMLLQVRAIADFRRKQRQAEDGQHQG